MQLVIKLKVAFILSYFIALALAFVGSTSATSGRKLKNGISSVTHSPKRRRVLQ